MKSSGSIRQNLPKNYWQVSCWLFFFLIFFRQSVGLIRGRIPIRVGKKKISIWMQCEEMAWRFFQRTNRTPDPRLWFSGEECFSSKKQQFVFSAVHILWSTSPAATFTVHLYLSQPREIPSVFCPGVKMMNGHSEFISHSWRLLIQNQKVLHVL